MDVGIRQVADQPARLREQFVDALPGFLFWRHAVSLCGHSRGA